MEMGTRVADHSPTGPPALHAGLFLQPPPLSQPAGEFLTPQQSGNLLFLVTEAQKQSGARTQGAIGSESQCLSPSWGRIATRGVGGHRCRGLTAGGLLQSSPWDSVLKEWPLSLPLSNRLPHHPLNLRVLAHITGAGGGSNQLSTGLGRASARGPSRWGRLHTAKCLS